MNIDERIQALTESVELLASFHRDTDERLAKLLTAVGNLTGQVGILTGQVETLTGQVETLTSHMHTIAQAVIQHEQRIHRLEEKQ